MVTKLLRLLESPKQNLGLGFQNNLVPLTHSILLKRNLSSLAPQQPLEKLKEGFPASPPLSKGDGDKTKKGKEEEEEEEEDDGGVFVNKVTGEVGGPRGPEPTRFGDWERNGRCSDF